MAALFRSSVTATKFARSFSVSAARSDLNKIQLIGRIGADPTVHEISENSKVVNYTVATSETRPDKEGNLIKRTQWHRVSAWKGSDWIVEKVKKGDLVYVEGKLRYSDYTDREGIQRTKAEINQTTLKVLTQGRGHGEEEIEE
ncbi:hypothetical protein J3Q64DRAFT_1711066 [Phycomyces blakesleeanus]|uniref:Uncharacterized protein n=2 Tax=Phycomyces blakesleeanus TaxID=4837 RepID=A0A162ZRQ3_PHYB8|nr:hypothetical protein PHYBLDRAFT_188623 [Phycomyces blakesleeanus NRRL 1555(-)]OAD68641.1 hypothetical protein PHYBLDRAFT_188623 [Phycomyces blakesleeanus NRRL 1555(-)]|eukprot:XP_018286681.1 hypothetical protein PHYBLDRAFT_188623 [Phycomyces blakesleeanus NRRL 1555(-)]